jgi:hypothetical protein
LIEQLEKDIEEAMGRLEEAKAGGAKLRKELDKLAEELATSEVTSSNFTTLFPTHSFPPRPHTPKPPRSSRKNAPPSRDSTTS